MNGPLLLPFVAWLLTAALHGGLLLSVLWLTERVWRAPPAWRELLWRCALFGGAVTAALQLLIAISPAGDLLRFPVSADTYAASRAPAYVAVDASAQTSKKLAAARNVLLTGEHAEVTDAAKPNDVAQRDHTQGFSLSGRFGVALLAVWLLGVAFNVGRLLHRITRLHRSLRRAVAIEPDTEAGRELAALVRQRASRQPRLYSLAGIGSPMALAARRIILPTWAVTAVDAGQRRAMLAHELAHIGRRDPQWKLLVAIWRAVFWMQPFAALAQRRLDEIAEIACDASAAQCTGDARKVAECLAACAERQVKPRSHRYALAAAMAAPESPLLQRIDRLLEGTAMQTGPLPLRHRALVLCGFALCGLVLPAVTTLQSARATGAVSTAQETREKASPATKSTSSSSVSTSDHDGKESMSLVVSDDNHSFSANVDGKITFAANESDVESLSAGGTANFEEKRDGVVHRMEFSERGGQLERRYFVDRHAQPVDTLANQWLAGFLPAMIRETGLGADARFKRLLSTGGVTAVLDECQQIHSDYARGIYLDLLADQGQLAPVDLDRALRLAGGLGSDYARHQTLSRYFAKQTLSGAQQVTFLQQAQAFSSDYERAELLVGVLPRLDDSAQIRQAWLTAALGLSSDYEKGRTLRALLAHKGVDDSQLETMIQASQSLGSDHERSELLIAIARHAQDIEAIAPAYARSTRDLGSDYERRETLLALIHGGTLGARGSDAVLESMADFGSNYDSREVLVALARVMPDDRALVERYRKIAAGLSDSDRAQAENALVR